MSKKTEKQKVDDTFILKNSFINIYHKIVIACCFLISFTVMLGWIFKIRFLLSILPESATMKFNTALIFFIAGINLVIIKINNKSFKIVYKFLAVTTILIGVISILEFLGISIFDIDNVIIKDNYSLETPGRMSPATAMCSILIGLGFLGNQSNIKIIKKISEDTVMFVSLISLIAIISYILVIPLEKKSYLFQTMAIHTSILFFVISILLILKNNSLYLINLAKGKTKSSKTFKNLLPKVFFFPIVLACLLLIAISYNLINTLFAISSFILILIFLNIIYISHIAKNFDVKKNKKKEKKKNII